MYGQLGHGNIDDQYYPKIVDRLKKKVIIVENNFKSLFPGEKVLC